MAEIKVTAQVELPKLPNFLRYAGGTIDVADISTEDLRNLGAAWTTALVEHALQRRRTRNEKPGG